MKHLKVVIFIFLILLIGWVVVEASSKKSKKQDGVKSSDKLKFENFEQKVGYALGFDIGRNLNRQNIDLDKDMFISGFKSAISGAECLLSDTEIQEVMMEFQQQLMAKRQAEHTKNAEANMKKSEDFLKENAKKEGVVALPSGVQYKILKEGKGEQPKTTDEIVAHYKGMLINGTVFDSSYERNEPLRIPVSGVIQGWTEILQLMPVGSKWEVYIPAEHGYGAAGAPPVIGPNETLIFEIELLEIIK